MWNRKRVAALAAIVGAAALAVPATAGAARNDGLWRLYDRGLSQARYIDLTHDITPTSRSGRASARRCSAATVDPARAAVHVRRRRLRGDGLSTSRPTSSARSSTRRRTGRRSSRRSTRCPRRTRSARCRDLDRPAGDAQDPKYSLQVVRHQGVGAPARPHPRGLGRDGPVRLVEALDRRPGQGQGAGRGPGLPRRRARRDEVPAPQAPHPLPRPRAARHRHDADARGRGLADAPRLRAGRGRREPRRGVPATGCLVSIGFPKFKGGWAATRASSRSARPSTRRPPRSRAATLPCRGSTRRCTGIRSSATGRAEPATPPARAGAPAAAGGWRTAGM